MVFRWSVVENKQFQIPISDDRVVLGFAFYLFSRRSESVHKLSMLLVISEG